jgi:hypothetical protein
MEVRSLDFDDDDFGPDARELMELGIPFTFVLSGRAHEALAPHLSGQSMPDPVRMGVSPVLQVLLALLMLAQVFKQTVSIEPGPTTTRFNVGFAQA